MRGGAVAVVAFVAAALGASAVLVISKAAGWLEGESGPAQTVVLPAATGAAASSAAPSSAPLVGNTFDPAGIYRRTSPGVVTIYAIFEGGSRSQGSGLIVSREGHVLTNSHVIRTPAEASVSPRTASSVFVAFADGDRLPATIVGYDLFNDTGVIKLDPGDHTITPVPLGDSDDVVVGEPVAAIGSPFGNENSLAVGVVSAVSRSIPSLTSRYSVANAIQTDAPINRGNSGGPMFDAAGRVIGINAQIRSTSGTAEGVGFAIPIDIARRSLEQLLETGRVRYAYIGVQTQDVTPGIAEAFDLAVDRGALITRVESDTPAATAGLRGGSRSEVYNGLDVTLGGDLIVAIGGRPVRSAEDVSRLVTSVLRPGQTVAFTVLRGGTKRATVDVTLGDRPANPG